MVLSVHLHMQVHVDLLSLLFRGVQGSIPSSSRRPHGYWSWQRKPWTHGQSSRLIFWHRQSCGPPAQRWKTLPAWLCEPGEATRRWEMFTQPGYVERSGCLVFMPCAFS